VQRVVRAALTVQVGCTKGRPPNLGRKRDATSAGSLVSGSTSAIMSAAAPWWTRGEPVAEGVERDSPRRLAHDRLLDAQPEAWHSTHQAAPNGLPSPSGAAACYGRDTGDEHVGRPLHRDALLRGQRRLRGRAHLVDAPREHAEHG